MKRYAAALIAAWACAFASWVEAGAPTNVLMIIVDDLRPELNCYGAGHMRTPHIDRLAAEGMRFDRAYCQQAVCLPSRISLFTGMRPDATGVHGLQTHFRETIPEVVTLTQRLAADGYHTIGMGKVYHDEQWGEWADWVDTRTAGSVMEYHLDDILADVERRAREAKQQGLTGKARRQYVKGPSVEAADRPDTDYHDGAMTDLAIDKLKNMPDKPFFMAVGYKKPHLPFVAPKRYWDLYPVDGIRAPDNDAPPQGAPQIALTDWGELRAYSDIPGTGPVPEAKALELIRGYYACVSFTDAQVGRLLDALGETGLDRNTIVILWGDHGWKLGEHGMWCKHTNFELDTRVPLIIRLPAGDRGGRRTDALVELVDLYPTVCGLLGLMAPPTCDGTSLVPLLTDSDAPWNEYAYSQYKRPRRTGDIIGYSVKVPDGRYTEWTEVETGARKAVEYYDHRHDPGETRNAYQALTSGEARTLATALEAGRPPPRPTDGPADAPAR